MLVVKSPHPNPVLSWLGRRAIRREAGIYARLNGIAGIPQSYGLADGRHLALEHISGSTLRQAELADRERFFGQLLTTIRAMHEAGIAHGDLKRKENTLVAAADERPWIIDFGIACRGGPETSGLRRARFELTRQIDLNAWIKLKYGPNTDTLPEQERTLYRPTLIERLARRARAPWQLLSFRRARKRRRARQESGQR